MNTTQNAKWPNSPSNWQFGTLILSRHHFCQIDKNTTEHLKTDLHQFLVMYKVHKNDNKNFKSTKFQNFFLFLSKSNDNFGCRFDNSKMRELSKKSTIYFLNRQVIFQIDLILSQIENFLVDFRNCQNESKTCQLFFSVFRNLLENQIKNLYFLHRDFFVM
jgi:hypothetical protein